MLYPTGDLPIDQVREKLRETRMYECLGGPHVELGSMLDGYEWDWTVLRKSAPRTDEEWIGQLKKKGFRVLSGVQGEHPELPNLHDLNDLEHAGFGDFISPTHYYQRSDSPSGTRFYLEISRTQNPDERHGGENA